MQCCSSADQRDHYVCQGGPAGTSQRLAGSCAAATLCWWDLCSRGARGLEWEEWQQAPRDWQVSDRANYGRHTVPRTEAWRPSLYSDDQASPIALPPGLRQQSFPIPPIPGPRGPVAPPPGPPSDVYVGRAFATSSWDSTGGWWREQWSTQTDRPNPNETSNAASSSSSSWQPSSWHAEGWRRN